MTSEQWLAEWTDAGGTIAVPAVFLAEVCGAVARRSANAAFAISVLADILSDPAVAVLDVDRALAESAATISASHFVRGMDAIYIALAARLNVPLVTWDNEQLTRATGLIEVRDPVVSARAT